VAEPFFLVELIWASRCSDNRRAETSTQRTFAITSKLTLPDHFTDEELQVEFLSDSGEISLNY
jgi:hypothetical protein